MAKPKKSPDWLKSPEKEFKRPNRALMSVGPKGLVYVGKKATQEPEVKPAATMFGIKGIKATRTPPMPMMLRTPTLKAPVTKAKADPD